MALGKSFSEVYFKQMRFEAMRNRQGEAARRKILSCAAEIAPGENKPKFLDVGCGDGKLTVEFAAKIGARECYGIDSHEPALIEARRRGITVERVDLNNEPIPFPDSFFDVVLCHQVAEHLTNADNLFQEIWRVLRAGGRCLLSVPNLCSLHNRIFVLFGWHPTVISPSTKFSFGNPARGERLEEMAGHRHNTAFSPAGLKEMLEFYGFRIENYYGSGLHPFGDRTSQFLLKPFPGLGVVQIAIVRKVQAEGGK